MPDEKIKALDEEVDPEDERLIREQLANALKKRVAERQEFAKRARGALVDGNYSSAVSAFSSAIMLCVASTHGDVIQLAVSNRWKLGDSKRTEVADLYSGRALAHLNQDNFAESLKDAHAVNFLAPDTHASLSLLAAAAAGLADHTQEPVSFFTEDPMPGESKEQADARAVSMTQQLAHGLVADVFSMLSECEDITGQPPRGSSSAERAFHSTQLQDALDSRDYHAARSHGGLHPLGDREVTSRLDGDSAFTMMTMAIESLAAAEPFDHTTNTPSVALLAQTLISLTAYRLGCTEAPIACHPTWRRGDFHEDRVVEAWFRARVEQADAQSSSGSAKGRSGARRGLGEGAVPARLPAGTRVRIEGMKDPSPHDAPDVISNGEQGLVVGYDKVRDRYKVWLEGKTLPSRAGTEHTLAEHHDIRAKNLVVLVGTQVTGASDEAR